MNYELIWKSLRQALEAHKNLADKFMKDKDYKHIKTYMKEKLDYIDTLKKLMDDLEENMLGAELNDMEKEYKGDICK